MSKIKQLPLQVDLFEKRPTLVELRALAKELDPSAIVSVFSSDRYPTMYVARVDSLKRIAQVHGSTKASVMFHLRFLLYAQIAYRELKTFGFQVEGLNRLRARMKLRKL